MMMLTRRPPHIRGTKREDSSKGRRKNRVQQFAGVRVHLD